MEGQQRGMSIKPGRPEPTGTESQFGKNSRGAGTAKTTVETASDGGESPQNPSASHG